jgi:outer membrane lipoprotein-sorting protein
MTNSLNWRIRLAIIIIGSIALVAQASAQQITTGEALIRAMHDRYQNNWYQTLTFTQKSITHKPDGTTSSETWHEALGCPGKLRIDIGPLSDNNGIIFAENTVTSFKAGAIAGTRPFVHMLLVLGFDVYCQPAATTIDEAKGQGFDLSKLHEDTWQGEPVYVVGADKGDLKSKQFWIEKKRLLFVRMIEPDRHDATKTADTRFVDYRKTSPGWVAAGVEMYVDGKEVFSEEYSDIQINPKLDPAIFDPKQFAAQHWEK